MIASASAAGREAVRLDSVSVRRGGQLVLSDISCVMGSGQIVGLIGPSGCGKTTLMRTLVGVQANVRGDVVVLGRPAGQAARRGEVGYMTQDAAVYEDLSPVENLGYFARLVGVEVGRVGDVLDEVDLRDRASVPVGRLSGGQRARVSLAVALLNEPPLLVLDEPTVGLDPVLRNELWEKFSELARRGATLVVSSHVMDEAERCDHLLFMRNGTMLATGTPDELKATTGTTNVEAAFLHLIGSEVRR